MTKPKQQAELMEEIGMMLLRVANSLDRSTTECDKCGVSRNTNWTEAKLHPQLMAMSAKAARISNQLREHGA